jgi:predicted HicB family RNase H-like nuclease
MKGGKEAEEEEAEEIERVTTSLKINPKLWKKAKMVALEREIKLYELVENALKEEIGENEEEKFD